MPHPTALDWRSAGTSRPTSSRARPDALERRLRPALASPGRRPLRREPQWPLQAPPVPGDPEAGAGRGPAPLSAEPRGVRHQHRAARHPLRGGQLGIADPRRVGHRLAGALRRLEIKSSPLPQPAARNCRRFPPSCPTPRTLAMVREVHTSTPRVGSGVAYRRSASATMWSSRSPLARCRDGAGRLAAFHRDLFDRHSRFEDLVEPGWSFRARACLNARSLQRARSQRVVGVTNAPLHLRVRQLALALQGLAIPVARPYMDRDGCSRSVVRKSRPLAGAAVAQLATPAAMSSRSASRRALGRDPPRRDGDGRRVRALRAPDRPGTQVTGRPLRRPSVLTATDPAANGFAARQR